MGTLGAQGSPFPVPQDHAVPQNDSAYGGHGKRDDRWSGVDLVVAQRPSKPSTHGGLSQKKIKTANTRCYWGIALLLNHESVTHPNVKVLMIEVYCGCYCIILCLMVQPGMSKNVGMGCIALFLAQNTCEFPSPLLLQRCTFSGSLSKSIDACSEYLPYFVICLPLQIRNSFVLGTLWAAKRNALIVGSSGAGKTVLVFSELARLPETHSQLVMNFSATTDSGTTQVNLER